jgi:hypothetical protein
MRRFSEFIPFIYAISAQGRPNHILWKHFAKGDPFL